MIQMINDYQVIATEFKEGKTSDLKKIFCLKNAIPLNPFLSVPSINGDNLLFVNSI